jgi:hypothetical protein
LLPSLLIAQQDLPAIDTTGSGNNKMQPDKLKQPDQKNPFVAFTGKKINSIYIKNIEFDANLIDTIPGKSSFGSKISKALHRYTRHDIIRNHLLFKEGERLNPYVLADNEQFIRNQFFVQDAVIVVKKSATDPAAVDVMVLVKDVFSFGPGLGIGGTKKYRFELKEENLAGTGTRLAFNTLFDDIRNPSWGFGADLLKRNIRGSFINMNLGFKTYDNAFNTDRNEEQEYYIRFDKPLISQYLNWYGGLEASYNRSTNVYNIKDSIFQNQNRYTYHNIDGWIAWNFDARRLRYKNQSSGILKALAVRAFYQDFTDVPRTRNIIYDGTYSDVAGFLGSFSVFRQNFYRATYVYGFGRYEDLPQGFNLAFTGGYIARKDSLNPKLRTRPYYGADFQWSKYNQKGFYTFYTVRLGGFRYNNKWEDLTLLVNTEHFTRLKKLKGRWYKRYFFNGGFAKQFTPVLDPNLQLRSQFGLPYFRFGYGNADFRITARNELVLYHTKKTLGFGFAPFAFADFCLLKPVNQSLSKSDLFTGLGGGFRIRNENLIFGTIEARFSWFPRVVEDMNHFRFKLSTSLQYKYNSSFVRKPDFVNPN